MGTVVCHPLGPSEFTSSCRRCVNSCLPSIIVRSQDGYELASSRLSASDSAYVLSLPDAKVAVTENYLDTQILKGNFRFV
ncbi:unnamed protein product [Hermetia illucens]|uniref:Uncharacterized protein n=1 Tax=Hermetia illucens TaxID=343691 RepID=A0A7R8UEF2_HERIL|nr:unnamed protein product [Hermetia illucens]